MKALDRGTCKAARMLIDWTAAQLADAAEVSQDTLRSFESGRTRTLSRENETAIRKALEAQGVQFLESGQIAAGPGVALGAGQQ
jgi:transcriptional regulator with XRE-family HTH domain